MESRRLTVSEVLQVGFNKTVKHFTVCLLGVLESAVIGSLVAISLVFVNWSFVSKCIELMDQITASGESMLAQRALFLPLLYSHWVLLIISSCIALPVFAALILGLFHYFLNVYDKGSASVKDLFPSLRQTIRFLIASILFSLIIIGGLVLFIVPGIYLAIRFGQFMYFIVDRNAGSIESLKMSWAVTHGYEWQIFFLAVTIGMIGFVSSKVAIISLITKPMRWIMYACIYRRLTGHHGKSE